MIGVLRRATDCQPSSNWRSGSGVNARPFTVRRRRCRTLAWFGSSRAAAPLFKKISSTIPQQPDPLFRIVKRQAKTPSVTLLRSATIPVDQATSEALAVALGAPVALIETIGQVDDQPISLVGHHFALDRFPDVRTAYEAERKITPMLARLGVADYFRKSTTITARMPDGYEMPHLRVARMAPILCLEAINVDGRGAPIEYGLTRFSSSRVQILIDTLPP